MAFIDRLKNWWTESSPTQRYTTLGGVMLFVLLLGGVFSFASRPKYDMLYSGVTELEKATMVEALQAMGVPTKYDNPGMVEIPSDKIHEMRSKLTLAGKVPKSAHMGYENLADMSLSDTPAKERERLKAIAEGELARSIETNPGVRSARVHITLGDPSPFGDQQRPPSASVNLVTSGNGSITRDQAKGIAMLVSHSLDGMDMKNVVVLDEKSIVLYSGSDSSSTDALASSKIELEQSVARKEEQRIQNNLDAIFGPGKTRVSVRATVNLDQNEVTKVENLVKKGVALKSMEEKMGSKKVAGGVAGTQANTLAPTSSDTDDKNGEYFSKVEQLQPNSTQIETHSNKAVGSIQSMVINVAANTSGFPEGQEDKAEEFVAQVKQFVDSEKKTGDTILETKVTPVKFDETVRSAVTESVAKAESSAKMQQMMALLPIAALLVIGVMVVKQLSKMKPLATTTAILTAEGQTVNVPLVNGQIPSNYAMVMGQHPGLVPAEQRAQDLRNNLARYSEEELAQLAEGGIIYRDNGGVMEVEKIAEKKSVHLAAIKQMARDRPEPTAMLIKTWLAEV
ncbi:MAG: flagellar basal-body MS-ring/collar protein FliF [Fimbriimonas sp.]|nr:flagellar basal-body MS-ring/collar protein FliF [Fimbriimonas sp.]